ncbi:Histone deacetylase 11 [Anabarilius grahami]|uniref:Histone deacetylase 11 n=1 Tax=Anabarilius grahami TaxID=495550 RepID=A0A3N0XVE6_ANAGA|nr:Histone deacetylase 11 [Anabarilius grahami]
MYFSHLRCGPGGTVLAGEIALQRGLACSTAGGTHHAFPGYGAGFCLLNDLAVAAKHLMGESASKRKILIVDLDVHQVLTSYNRKRIKTHNDTDQANKYRKQNEKLVSWFLPQNTFVS